MCRNVGYKLSTNTNVNITLCCSQRMQKTKKVQLVCSDAVMRERT
jgi:hypothetical protein